MSFSSSFITLTYDGENVPISPNGFMTLWKPDLQNFFKRLRYYTDQSAKATGLKFAPIKYYAAGEYGSDTYRPHYHIIIFNAHHDHIEMAWEKGFIHFGNVTGASVAYSLKYISKPPMVGKFSRDDRKREFSLMSKGIGKSWVTPEKVAWYQQDPVNRQYAMSDFGTKIPIPRYYKPFVLNHKQIHEAMEQALNKEFMDWQRLTEEKKVQQLNVPYAKQRSHERKFTNTQVSSLELAECSLPDTNVRSEYSSVDNRPRPNYDNASNDRTAYQRAIDSIIAKRTFIRTRRGFIWHQSKVARPSR